MNHVATWLMNLCKMQVGALPLALDKIQAWTCKLQPEKCMDRVYQKNMNGINNLGCYRC